MKNVVNIRFVVACLFLMGSLLFVSHRFAQTQGAVQYFDGSKCLTAPGDNPLCYNAGYALCQAGLPTCMYCNDTTTSIPKKFCALGFEGQQCYLTGGKTELCNAGTWLSGECLHINVGGIEERYCGGLQLGQSCGSGAETPVVHVPCI